MTRMMVVFCGVLAIGCADAGTTRGNPDASDVSDSSQDGARVLELGTCEVAETGDPCTGVADEVGVFALREPGDPMTIVTGPQGSSMFVFAARTMDIDPGDPATPYSTDNPLVEIRLEKAETGEEMAIFRSRAAFVPDPSMDGRFLNLELFVVVDGFAAELDGAFLRAEATLTDAGGQRREGTLSFVGLR